MIRMIAGRTRAYTPQALALFARMTTPPTDPRKRLIDNAIRTMLASGAWGALSALWVPAAANTQAASLNWLSSSYALTRVNSPTFTADRGYQGDGATSYLSTTYDGSNLGTAYAAGVWTNVNGGGTAFGAANGVTIRPNIGSSKLSVYAGGAFFTDVTVSGAGVGFSAYGQTSGVLTVQKDASQTHPASPGYLASFGLSYNLLATNTFGSGAQDWSTFQLAAAFIGPGLTDPQMSSVYTALSGYLTPIGAA